MDAAQLSAAFRARRLALRLTQQDAAARALLTRKTVSDFENGRSSISLANLRRLLAAVGLELSVREAARRPTLDELAGRYALDDELPPARRRAPRRR
jgi:transcriptional regulator with XRE-family HTH domain